MPTGTFRNIIQRLRTQCDLITNTQYTNICQDVIHINYAQFSGNDYLATKRLCARQRKALVEEPESSPGSTILLKIIHKWKAAATRKGLYAFVFIACRLAQPMTLFHSYYLRHPLTALNFIINTASSSLVLYSNAYFHFIEEFFTSIIKAIYN